MESRPAQWCSFGAIGTAEVELEAEDTVHQSIIAASKAEYCDVFGATVGTKAVKEIAAKAAMEQRLKSGSIDSFGFLEAVASDPTALQEFYTFATAGQIQRHVTSSWSASAPCELAGASHHICDYPSLSTLFNEHVRMCLVSQQKLEAFF